MASIGPRWTPVVNGGYGLWVADYTYDPNKFDAYIGAWPFAVLQQWTDKQEVPGIDADVDGDCFFGDASTFHKYGYQYPIVPPPVIPTETSPVAVASTPTPIVPSVPISQKQALPNHTIPQTPFGRFLRWLIVLLAKEIK